MFPENESKEELQAAYKTGAISFSGELCVVKDNRDGQRRVVFRLCPPKAEMGSSLSRKWGSDRFLVSLHSRLGNKHSLTTPYTASQTRRRHVAISGSPIRSTRQLRHETRSSDFTRTNSVLLLSTVVDLRSAILSLLCEGWSRFLLCRERVGNRKGGREDSRSIRSRVPRRSTQSSYDRRQILRSFRIRTHHYSM